MIIVEEQFGFHIAVLYGKVISCYHGFALNAGLFQCMQISFYSFYVRYSFRLTLDAYDVVMSILDKI